MQFASISVIRVSDFDTLYASVSTIYDTVAVGHRVGASPV
jgi:hypothetical protein